MRWVKATEAPIEINGLIDKYRRVPSSIADKCNENLKRFADCSSGGRVRFATDSGIIALRIELERGVEFPQFPLSCNMGADLYVNGEFAAVFVPEDNSLVIEGKYHKYSFEFAARAEVMIHLPLINHVVSMEIGIDDNAHLFAPVPYKNEKPIVFYGSSITHGIAASRPGNTYPARLSRILASDFINLGFGGGCRGEVEIAEYIASLDMRMLVMEYDHNAPTVVELEERHERFFNIIRHAHPKLPVLFITKPDFLNDPQNNALRRDVIYSTYSRAQSGGDENVWFLEGRWLYETDIPRDRTADWIHPTDRGFEGFARVLEPIIKTILKIQQKEEYR